MFGPLLLDRNNKLSPLPFQTDAYRKPMDRNTVEYVIHLAYLYIYIYMLYYTYEEGCEYENIFHRLSMCS